jgi:hypothetical protein
VKGLKLNDALETFGIYLTLPKRWKQKLEEKAKECGAPGLKGQVQDAVRLAIALAYFPEECEVSRKEEEKSAK